MVFYRGKSRGRRGSRRGRSVGLVATAVGCLIGAAALGVGPAFAVHDLVFQLDGDVNAATTTNVGGHAQTIDWSSFFNAAGEEISPLPADFDASSFDRDFGTNANGSFNTSDNTTFATGSKDTLGDHAGVAVQQDANVNSKIDVMNAYAASYTASEWRRDPVLRAGAQRQHRHGQRGVLVPAGRERRTANRRAATTAFTGAHVDGDLLVVSEFTKGGVVSTIQVYRWNGGANGALNPNPVASGVDCTTTAATTRRAAASTPARSRRRG